MRVAVLHDHLSFIGGGERVALALAGAFDADLFVTDLDPGLPTRAGLRSVRATELGKAPRTPILRQERQAAAFRRAELPGYDVYVFSGNWAIEAAPRHRPNLWYCHTPTRVFYDLREDFLRDLSPPKRVAARAWIRRARPRYEADVATIGRVVANSRNVAGRVARYLHRSAEVVYPPVDTARYRFEEVGDFWLSVNRLSHEKRIELQVEALRQSPRERLVVVGGPQMGVDAKKFLRSLRPPKNVEFLGEVEEGRLIDLYAKCRGLLATSRDEDFGLAPVEAMAAGKPVIAVDEGGYRESVVPDQTGWLVSAAPESLARAMESAVGADLEGMRSACEAQARRFDTRAFIDAMQVQVRRAAEGK